MRPDQAKTLEGTFRNPPTSGPMCKTSSAYRVSRNGAKLLWIFPTTGSLPSDAKPVEGSTRPIQA
eukprot:4550202-Prorocentrum_lima.AAC.1